MLKIWYDYGATFDTVSCSRERSVKFHLGSGGADRCDGAWAEPWGRVVPHLPRGTRIKLKNVQENAINRRKTAFFSRTGLGLIRLIVIGPRNYCYWIDIELLLD
jgi:hypothetical protein